MTLLVTIGFGLVFFVLLMASVALHEIGHLLPAKRFGVKVPKYFVGFGRTLWSVRRGETEYGIKLFPLGGFVQLLGMYPPENPVAKQTWLQRFADDVRAAEWDEITPADQDRLFYQRRTWQKLVIMFGGPAMNLLIAFLLMWGVLAFHGAWREQPVVRAIAQCIVTEARPDGTCLPDDPLTPAAEAGLTAGDRIVSFNGTPIAGYPQLQALIRANLGGEAVIVVERAGQTVTLPTVHTRVMPVADLIDPTRSVDAGWLGTYPVWELQRGGPVEALADLGMLVRQSVVALVQFPVRVWNVAVDLVTGKPRDVNSPISIVGASAIAGQAASEESLDPGARAALFVNLLAAINLFLALFNLVPLPPLDGGHMAGALWEGARRTIARWRGRPDPGPADTAKLVPVAYLVGGFLLLCGIVVIVADIVSPVRIF